MIYLLYGADTYCSSQKLQQIKEKYLASGRGEVDLIVLDGDNVSVDELRHQLLTVPLLANKRLMIIKNLLTAGKKDVQEDIINILPSVPETTVVFFYEAGEPDKRGKLFSALNKPKVAEHFPQLLGLQLLNYVKSMTELQFEAGALERLLELTNSDLWQVENELEKLKLYKKPETSITISDVDLLVSGVPSVKIFDLADAFGERKGERARVLLRNTLISEENPLGLVAFLAGHYRNLLLADDNSIQSAKLHPFVVSKAKAQAKNYTYSELVKIFHYLFELDLLAKQSIIEPVVGLAVLAATITNKPIKLPQLTEASVLQLH